MTLMLLIAGGCTSTGVMMSGNDNGEVNDNGSPAERSVSFSRDIQPILTARCAVCHVEGGVADRQGIELYVGVGESYGKLVDQPSSLQADLTLVIPGDAENSLLFQKIDSTRPPVGTRMPQLAAPLTEDQIETIKDWINQGALDN